MRDDRLALLVTATPETMTVENQRISFFLPKLAGGGAERAMLHLAEGFADRGLTVDLVLAEASGEYLDQVSPKISIVDLKSTRPVIVTKTLALRRYLQQEQPSVLFSALDILSSALWARGQTNARTRIVMCVQTYLSEQFQNHQRNTIARFRRQMVRWLYPKADAIVAASLGTAKDVAEITGLPIDRIDVAYNPVVTPEMQQKIHESIDHPWFAPDQPPVLLGVGRLVSQKDFFTLIRAFAEVRAVQPARLMILGEGEQRSQLEQLIHELQLDADVALPGFVENPYAYMAHARVFVLSSRFEGFGNVVAEALATGTAVVATDCPSGPAEILDYGKYGKLVPTANPSALATAILETLESPADSDALKARSLEFTRDRIVDQYLTVVEQLISS